MVDVPTLENPVELREWRFLRDRLVDREGRERLYDAIVHMGLAQHVTKRNSVAVKADGIMRLWISGGDVLEVNISDKLPRAGDPVTKTIVNLWKVLSEATLPQRVKPYIDQYMADGYFDFGGLAENSAPARFFRGGRVEQGDLHANIKTDRYSIGNGFFSASIPEKTALEELMASEKRITVSTVVDGDVFYTLIPIILSS